MAVVKVSSTYSYGHRLKTSKASHLRVHLQAGAAQSERYRLLNQVPDEKHREFRMLAICVAFIWIGLIDEIRRAGSTRPPAAQRLSDGFTQFGEPPENSVALEISSYVLKAFFDPTTSLPQPVGAFIDRLIGYSRRG